MTVKPVENTPAPGYPDKYAEESRQALAVARPRRWVAAPVAAGLAVTVALGLSGCDYATAGVPPIPMPETSVDYTTLGVPAIVPTQAEPNASTQSYTLNETRPIPAGTAIPLFEYGEGTGAFGCVSIAAPVFMSEEEAFAILSAAFAKAGLELDQSAQTLKRANIPVTNVNYEDIKRTKRGDLEPDGQLTGLPVEFVSKQDVSAWEGNTGTHSSVSLYAFKQTAKLLAKKNPGLVVFYDPVTYWDIAQGQGNHTGEFTYEKTEQDARAESEKLLRQQVSAFLQWLETEGAR